MECEVIGPLEYIHTVHVKFFVDYDMIFGEKINMA